MLMAWVLLSTWLTLPKRNRCKIEGVERLPLSFGEFEMRYEVIIPWLGVTQGDVIETDSLHPAIRANVRELPADAFKPVSEPEPKQLEVSTPKPVESTGKRPYNRRQ